MGRYPGWSDKLLEHQLRESIKAAKKNKYNAKKVTIDGYNFDSKAEGKRYIELRLMHNAGLIRDLVVHPSYQIPPEWAWMRNQEGQEQEIPHICVVELDFCYFQDGNYRHEDIKGLDNPLSKLKRKLVEAFYGIKVVVVKR